MPTKTVADCGTHRSTHTIRAVHDRSLRASDADRERVAVSLRDHAVAGRLTTDELDARTGRAFAARTLRELDALLADLPRERRRGSTPARAALLLAEGALYVVVGLIIVTIAILWALAWAGARLARAAAAAVARSLDSAGTPAIRRGS
jgi:Domain of unknown function (DUF1707)